MHYLQVAHRSPTRNVTPQEHTEMQNPPIVRQGITFKRHRRRNHFSHTLYPPKNSLSFTHLAVTPLPSIPRLSSMNSNHRLPRWAFTCTHATERDNWPGVSRPQAKWNLQEKIFHELEVEDVAGVDNLPQKRSRNQRTGVELSRFPMRYKTMLSPLLVVSSPFISLSAYSKSQALLKHGLN